MTTPTLPENSDAKPPVLTKSDFVKRYKAGEFGNASPTWNNVKEFKKSGYRGLVHIRNRVANAQTWYNVPFRVVSATWLLACVLGFEPEQLYISAMAPEYLKVFQGEVQQTERYLDLHYNRQPLPMREGFAVENLHMFGLTAMLTLRKYLCPNSLVWLEYLLGAYPHHIIEFSTYSTDWGTIPHYNTVFWEVRQY